MALTPGRGDGAVTVSLRALRAPDAGWLDGWLAGVAADAGMDRSDAATLQRRLKAGPGARAWIIERDGASVGLIAARIGLPQRDSAIIELVATPPSEARRGAAMSAAAAIEPVLRRAGVRRVYAPAAAARGISVYFWVRLGYHPLLRGEWPCAAPGVGWLARDL